MNEKIKSTFVKVTEEEEKLHNDLINEIPNSFWNQ